MLLAVLLAASILPLLPLDEAWARLARDAAAPDPVAFDADRAEIVRLDREEMARWSANPREIFRGRGYTATTYTGPTRARGERWHSAHFAVVTPDDALGAPTFWEVTPGFSPGGGALWALSVSGCDLRSGDSLVGHVKYWRTSGLDRPPTYEEFRASLAPLAAERRAFPEDTSVATSPGAKCLYVGNIGTQPIFARP